jgi:hypothetical protein
MNCIIEGCHRPTYNGRICRRHAFERFDALLDREADDHSKLEFITMSSGEDDWRAEVVRRSALPSCIRFDPESKSAARYLRPTHLPRFLDRHGISVEEPEDGISACEDDGATFVEMADSFECSATRVRQIAQRAIRELRSTSPIASLEGKSRESMLSPFYNDD